MARTRTIPPDFWTLEAVVNCAPMTRLLFIGLWTFADDRGVQPLRPRTIRMQVFPGDEIGDDAVRAMIDELAAQGLVRLHGVEGREYVTIVDWDRLRRVGKRARRRYPPAASTVPDVGEAGEQPSRAITNHRSGERGAVGNAGARRTPPFAETGERPPRTIENHNNSQPEPPAEEADRRRAQLRLLSRVLPGGYRH